MALLIVFTLCALFAIIMVLCGRAELNGMTPSLTNAVVVVAILLVTAGATLGVLATNTDKNVTGGRYLCVLEKQ